MLSKYVCTFKDARLRASCAPREPREQRRRRMLKRKTETVDMQEKPVKIRGQQSNRTIDLRALLFMHVGNNFRFASAPKCRWSLLRPRYAYTNLLVVVYKVCSTL
jgi:hypothetical protein